MEKGLECHAMEPEHYAKGHGETLEGCKPGETCQVRALERSL